MSNKVASANVLDKLVGFGVKLIDFYNHLDIQTLFKAFLETMVAISCSCFPPMDSFNDDENDPPSRGQKQVNDTRDKKDQFSLYVFEKTEYFLI